MQRACSSGRRLRIEEENAYAAVLRRCCEARDLDQGKRVHAFLASNGDLDGERYLGNLLLQMYGACRDAASAVLLFDNIRERNIFSWNILLAACAQNGSLQLAECIFEACPQVNVVSWTTMITAYAHQGDVQGAKAVFDSMSARNLVSWSILMEAYGDAFLVGEARNLWEKMPQRDVVCSTSLVTAYAQEGHVDEASDLFDSMPHRNLISVNATVGAYAGAGHLRLAVELFDKMPERDAVSSTAMIMGYAVKGQIQQAHLLLKRMPQRDLVSCVAMVAACSGCRRPNLGREVFDKMPQWNVVAWNAMASAYAQNGEHENADKLLECMPERDMASWNLLVVVKGCMWKTQEAKRIFDTMQQRNRGSWVAMATANGKDVEAARRLMQKVPRTDVAFWNLLLISYVNAGDLDGAADVFWQQMPSREEVSSWTCMMQAMLQNERWEKAVWFFKLMDLEGVSVDKAALLTGLAACSGLGQLPVVKVLHTVVNETAHGPDDVAVRSALVDAYGSCGNRDMANSVFEVEQEERDNLSWNSIISASSKGGGKGAAEESLTGLWSMALEGAQADEVTLLNVLVACSHGGCAERGMDVFTSMKGDYGLDAGYKHYRCMVDLLGRLGHLEEAQELVANMPFVPDLIDWRSLLAACKVHGDVNRAVHAADQVRMQSGSANVASCLLLSHILHGIDYS